MQSQTYDPIIQTVYDRCGVKASTRYHHAFVCEAVRRALPASFFLPVLSSQERRRLLAEQLPTFCWSPLEEIPVDISFLTVCPVRRGATVFCLEMLSRYLVPGKRLNVVLFSAVDFIFPELGEDRFTVSEIVMHFEDPADLLQAKRHLPALGTEIRLGVQSTYHAGRILESRGLTPDEKGALIQEATARLARSRPKYFDNDIYAEMQRFLVMCGDQFKALHEWRHMSRLICLDYLFWKQLCEKASCEPKGRHLKIKVLRARVQGVRGRRRVLGVLVSMNLVRENEVFGQRHLQLAIKAILPGVQMVEGSFFIERRRAPSIVTLYLEVERSDAAFTTEDVWKLRKALPSDLLGRVQKQMFPIFMPRNEEEVLRHIVTLSEQLRYVRDLPQVIISFHEQSDAELSFTVVILRVIRDGALSFEQLLQREGRFLRISVDHLRIVGYLRRRYAKEAAVLRLHLPKEQFLRGDHSLDIRRARQCASEQLRRLIGDFRDYYGGMLAKQYELFSALKASLGTVGRRYELLLENFFHAITPDIMRSVLEAGPLQRWFLLFLQLMERGWVETPGHFQVQEDPDFLYIVVASVDLDFARRGRSELERLGVPKAQLAEVVIEIAGRQLIGYLYRSDDPAERQEVTLAIERSLTLTGELVRIPL